MKICCIQHLKFYIPGFSFVSISTVTHPPDCLISPSPQTHTLLLQVEPDIAAEQSDSVVQIPPSSVNILLEIKIKNEFL